MTSCADEDVSLQALIAPDHACARAKLAQPVGVLPAPLHSYCALFGPDPSLSFMAAASAHAAGAFIPPEHANLPLLSAAAPSRFGGRGGPDNYVDIPAGPITLRHIAHLCTYPNDLRLVIARGGQIRDWLEMSARVFQRIPQGAQDIPLLNPDAAGHNFCVMHGLRYRINLSAPPRFDHYGDVIDPGARRICDLTYRGRAVAAEDKFAVVTNSYRANGGGHFKAVGRAEHISIPPIRMRQAVLDYLEAGCPAPGWDAVTWDFTPIQGASARMDIGPGARAVLDGLNWPDLQDLGTDARGFLKLRLPF